MKQFIELEAWKEDPNEDPVNVLDLRFKQTHCVIPSALVHLLRFKIGLSPIGFFQGIYILPVQVDCVLAPRYKRLPVWRLGNVQAGIIKFVQVLWLDRVSRANTSVSPATAIKAHPHALWRNQLRH